MITLICSECGGPLEYGPITISGTGDIEAAVAPCACSMFAVFDSEQALRNERGET